MQVTQLVSQISKRVPMSLDTIQEKWEKLYLDRLVFFPAKKYKAGQNGENYTWTDSSSRNNIWSSFSSTDLNVNILINVND